jgi:hypothetical protein
MKRTNRVQSTILAGAIAALFLVVALLSAGDDTRNAVAQPTAVPQQTAPASSDPEPWELDEQAMRARTISPIEERSGEPAITPVLLESVAADAPAITVPDVLAWASAHPPVPFRGELKSKTSVERVEFMTEAELRKVYDKTAYVTEDRLLCLIFVKGQFVAYGADGSKVPYSTAIQILDARTGNWLVTTTVAD